MSESAVNSKSATKEVLVVAEDSVPNRKILVTILQKMGFAVVETSDGAEAWAFLKEPKDYKVLAIITDMMMPNMSGLELLGHCRSSDVYRDTPILLVTAVSDRDAIVQAKGHNVNGYMLKPIRSEVLFHKLTEFFPNHDGLKLFGKTVLNKAA